MPSATFDFRSRCLIKSGFTRSCLEEGAVSQEHDLEAESLGLKSPSDWRVLSLPRAPGLLLLPDLFREGGQHRWIRRCLVDYPRKPNICNLDAHMEREGDGSLWPSPADDREGAATPPLGPSEAVKKPRLCRWGASPGGLAIPRDSALHKLRWVTLGYHYDWDTKTYSSERRSSFPADLAALSSFILRHAGFPG